jgi:hypothetical protein
MRRAWAVVGTVIAGVTLGGASAVVLGARSWRRDTARAVDALLSAPPGAERTPNSAADPSAELPAPVARYLHFALPVGAVRAREARIRWTGEFRMRPDGAWAPFTAEQAFTIHPPGFVWDARIRMLPLVPVRVRDAYRAGRGSMLGRVAGLVPVVDEAGTPEMAQSALARWLGEAAWFPTALLPGGSVRWEAVDDSTARAVATDGAVSASADFHFAPDGAIARMTALRWRDVDGTAVLTPFEGVYEDYARVAGVRVPRRAEVAWLLPEGRFAYWRGRPVEVRYGVTG